ncbi:signal recognition particle-docking protein FtsY [Candidatus Phytoplasma pruni]|uniref:Signal recognition particle-docking protein FtsY n=1 Tax=Candidatus Phytoplasma pruni TaxID=479893 RepID=A0A851HCY6_9MOLU|nr:signal recognition particle-docking protein FtsY [Candidatus Phytoplasma pruni]NWN45941.1 signal recognition particle-docking protein FtsY [Candidatus Phytoplasma pruni]
MWNFFKKIFTKKPVKKDILGVKKLGNNLSQWVQEVQKKASFHPSFLEDLEILLVKADVGIKTATHLITNIKNRLEHKPLQESSAFIALTMEEIVALYEKDIHDNSEDSLSDGKDDKTANTLNQQENVATTTQTLNTDKPQIYLFMGVNGVGKTTTIGKLAMKLTTEGQKVLLVAGDTFRTGAVEQLKIWGERTKSEVFFKEGNISPSAVIFDALTYAEKNAFDVVLCDTSGRLQNKVNLMKELEKIKKVIQKKFPQGPHESFLVLDSMTGQNGLNQIDLFNQSISLSGVILTKMDGAANGGLILAIKHLYNLETKYLGMGENPNDLFAFDIRTFIHNLFIQD